jgi:hypothetical protein
MMADDDALDALGAREIKELLTAARVDFADCFEKSELVKRLRQHRQAESADKVQLVKALANRSRSACCAHVRPRRGAAALPPVRVDARRAPLTNCLLGPAF